MKQFFVKFGVSICLIIASIILLAVAYQKAYGETYPKPYFTCTDKTVDFRVDGCNDLTRLSLMYCTSFNSDWGTLDFHTVCTPQSQAIFMTAFYRLRLIHKAGDTTFSNTIYAGPLMEKEGAVYNMQGTLVGKGLIGNIPMQANQVYIVVAGEDRFKIAYVK